MNALELRIPPPAAASILAVAMWGLSQYTPAVDVPMLVRALGALAIASVGGVVAAAGARAFRRAQTTVNPMKPENTSALVTDGIYGITRNPMYLGLLFVLTGWAFFLAAPWALAGPVAFYAYISRFQIAPEERVLSAMFGDAYAAYQAQVRRWL